MDLEGIVLSEVSQRKTNTVWSHLCVESKNKQANKNTLHQTHKKITLMINGGEWELEEGGKKVLFSNYKINDIIYHVMTIGNVAVW